MKFLNKKTLTSLKFNIPLEQLLVGRQCPFLLCPGIIFLGVKLTVKAIWGLGREDIIIHHQPKFKPIFHHISSGWSAVKSMHCWCVCCFFSNLPSSIVLFTSSLSRILPKTRSKSPLLAAWKVTKNDEENHGFCRNSPLTRLGRMNFAGTLLQVVPPCGKRIYAMEHPPSST